MCREVGREKARENRLEPDYKDSPRPQAEGFISAGDPGKNVLDSSVQWPIINTHHGINSPDACV